MPSVDARGFRPRTAAVATVVRVALGAGWLWLAGRDAGAAGALRQVPWVALASSLVWALLVRPNVRVDEAGVHLRNVVRDVDVPWARLESVDTRFALTLGTSDGRRFAAWAAPASGRHADVRMTRRDASTLGLGADEVVTASTAWTARSGAAAAWVRREWHRATTRELPDEPVAVRVAMPVVAAVGGSVALVLLTALFG